MSLPYIAEIKMFAGNFAPRGFTFCNGQLLSIAQNTALFSLVGTTYGGNGTTNFALPNLQGRFPMHWGNGAGLSLRVLGEIAGQENVTLEATQVPAHTHPFSASVTPPCSSLAGNSDSPVNSVPAANPAAENYAGASNGAMLPFNVSGNTGSAGGSQPHNNMPPYLCVSFIIALEGIYPSRN
jgi:microcystin-dependent protein